MTCPRCNANLPDHSRYCNICGTAQEPPSRFASDEQPRQPYQQPEPFGANIGRALDGKLFLILALCCFGYALLRGAPQLISLATALFNGVRMPHSVSGWFAGPILSIGFNTTFRIIVPVAAGIFFLIAHKKQRRE